jgi:hypothetical protein
MSNHHATPPSSSTFAEDAAAQNGAQPDAQATAEKAPHGATRPWFKKKILSVPLALLIVVILAVVAVVAVVAVNARSDPGTVTSPPKAAAVAPDIGTKVRDGAFEFLVTGVEHPGTTFEGKVGKILSAQGEFVIVRVDVTNVGKSAQRLSCSCQFLFNDKGQEFAPSPAILSTKDALKYVRWINPGDTVKDASVLFDVARGTKVLKIELHDSPSSPGVTVKLS